VVAIGRLSFGLPQIGEEPFFPAPVFTVDYGSVDAVRRLPPGTTGM
jgi:hypothetical protein